MKICFSILVILMCLQPFSAFAYIDPSSGSAIISAIIGFFVAISMTIKTYWYKIKRFFKGGEGSKSPKNESSKDNL